MEQKTCIALCLNRRIFCLADSETIMFVKHVTRISVELVDRAQSSVMAALLSVLDPSPPLDEMNNYYKMPISAVLAFRRTIQFGPQAARLLSLSYSRSCSLPLDQFQSLLYTTTLLPPVGKMRLAWLVAVLMWFLWEVRLRPGQICRPPRLSFCHLCAKCV